MKWFLCLMCVGLSLLIGCAPPTPTSQTDGGPQVVSQVSPEVPVAAPVAAPEVLDLPVFTITTSEYPSWSTLIVAGKAGLCNPARGGEYGPLEKKWSVDVVIEVKDYDPCIAAYGNTVCDATCMTNIDALKPSLGRASTAICPTSNSVGADKVIAIGVSDVDGLKLVPVHGLSQSVSHYCWYRGLEKNGKNPAEFKYVNLDPAPASTAMQTGSQKVTAICVWNPFALQTLRKVPESKAIFTSELIPGEIVDMIVVGNDVLAKPGGEAFAACLCDIQYEVNKKLQSPDTKIADAALTALGKDFCDLPLEDMKIVIQETQFYWTATDGIKWFKGDEFKEKMKIVVATCQKIQLLTDALPTIEYGETGSAQLTFTSKFMEKVSN